MPRTLTPAQRLAKIEGDRRRRREHKMEVRRLQRSERESQALVVTMRNQNAFLTEENERNINNLDRMREEIGEARQKNRELHQKNLGLEEYIKNAVDSFDFDREFRNNMPATEECFLGNNMPATEELFCGNNMPATEDWFWGNNMPATEKWFWGNNMPIAEDWFLGNNMPAIEERFLGNNRPSTEGPSSSQSGRVP